MRDEGPLSAAEVDAIFSQLEEKVASGGRFGLAVSGGPDSVALASIYAEWHRQHYPHSPRPLVLTVDHGLRPDAARDAEFVEDLARNLGFESMILNWTGPKPTTGIQAAARQRRYELLGGIARKQRLDGILLAHHADDQAETILMRLARGSGVDGLAGMASQTNLDGVDYYRPLLGITKARLEATLVARGITWQDDPSNEMVAFERVRIRKAQDLLAKVGLETASLTLTGRRMARARRSLERQTSQIIGELIQKDPLWHLGAMVWLPRNLPDEEIAIRVLSRAIMAIGGNSGSVELAQIEALQARLASGRSAGQTIGRVRIMPAPARFIASEEKPGHPASREPKGCYVILRETSRTPLPSFRIEPGQTCEWDGRFRIRLPSDAKSDFDVRSLPPGTPELAAPRGLGKRLWQAVLAGAPGIFRDQVPIAVPAPLGTGQPSTSGVPSVESLIRQRLIHSRERWQVRSHNDDDP